MSGMTLRAALVFSSLIMLTGCGDGGGGPADSTEAAAVPRLQSAYDTCKAFSNVGGMKAVHVKDAGSTMIIATKHVPLASEAISCIADELNTPRSIISRVNHTSSVMGELNGTSDNLNYSWTFHPDNGLNMVVTEQP